MFENKEKMVLVMEIAAGGELYDYISDRKTLGEPDARRIFRQIATAIYYAAAKSWKLKFDLARTSRSFLSSETWKSQLNKN